MKIIFDILLAIPIGIIYNILFHKLSEIMTDDLEYNDKIQKKLIIAFIGGILGLVIALKVFGIKKHKNRAIKFGLCLGSGLLLFFSIFNNWGMLANDIKLFMMIVIFVFLLWYAYTK